MSLDEVLNPAIPTTVGALLTEEVTMNPFTPFPSFYEMMLIEEAQRSAQKALKDGLVSLQNLSSQHRSQGSNSLLRKLKDRILYLVEFLIKKYGPEVRFFITYFIERRCIMGSSSTMSESIYGGMRVKVLPDNGLQPMTPRDRTRLILTISGSWYLDEKIQILFRKWDRVRSDRRSQFQIFLIRTYPYLRMTQNGTVLAYHLLYLMGKSKYFHPLSHLLRIAVRRLTHADVPEKSTNSSPTNQILQKRIPTLRRVAFWALTSTAVMGWLHQLHQQIRRQEQLHQPASLIPPPPPPTTLKLNPRDRIRIPESRDVCPLCQQPWIAPSTAPCGFVFCHKCLVLYVRDNGMCPLTGTPCKEKDIIRIYEPQSSAP